MWLKYIVESMFHDDYCLMRLDGMYWVVDFYHSSGGSHCRYLLPWKWKQQLSPKRCCVSAEPNDVIFLKIILHFQGRVKSSSHWNMCCAKYLSLKGTLPCRWGCMGLFLCSLEVDPCCCVSLSEELRVNTCLFVYFWTSYPIGSYY